MTKGAICKIIIEYNKWETYLSLIEFKKLTALEFSSKFEISCLFSITVLISIKGIA